MWNKCRASYFLLVILLLLGCGAKEAPSREQMLRDVAIQQQKWMNHPIKNYHIVYGGYGFNFRSTVSVTVKDGMADVSSFQCEASYPVACMTAKPDADPIEHLFEYARTVIADPLCVTTVTYDAHYSFPRSIRCNDIPSSYDHMHSLDVTMFVLAP